MNLNFSIGSIRLLNGLIVVLLLFSFGCATPRGDSIVEKQEYVRETRNKVLDELYGYRPELKQKIAGAEGYAVFSNRSVKIFVMGTGHGYGLLVNNQSGSETFMRMMEVGGGFGVGLKDFRVVFVFKNRDVMDRFVDRGWEFGADADASVVFDGDQGVSAAGQATVSSREAALGGEGKSGLGNRTAGVQGSVGDGIEIYQLTRNGIALQATVSGTKYWKDRKLN